MSDPLLLRCGSCEQMLEVPASAAGQLCACPRCQVKLRVPLPEPAPQAPSLAERSAIYEIRMGCILGVRAALPMWFSDHLPALLISLGGTASQPGILDLTQLERIDASILRLVTYAVLHSEVNRRPVRIHVRELQLPLFEDCGLDRLFQLSLESRSSGTGKLDRSQLEQLLAQRDADALPAGVTEQTYDEFDKGSYTRKLRAGFDPSAVPPYAGPERRAEARVAIDGALCTYQLGDRSRPADLREVTIRSCGLVAGESIATGHRVKLTLELPGVVSAIAIDARVVRCVRLPDRGEPPISRFQLGVVFASLPGAAMIKLRRLLAREPRR